MVKTCPNKCLEILLSKSKQTNQQTKKYRVKFVDDYRSNIHLSDPLEEMAEIIEKGSKI